MSSTSLAIKTLGGLAFTAAGTTGTYFLVKEINKSPATSFPDNFALDLTKEWRFKTNISDSFVEVMVKTSKDNKSWKCFIKGTGSISDGKTEINKQIETLKKELGIKEDKTRNKNKNHNFTTFLETCKTRMLTSSNNSSFMAVIDLGNIVSNKFNEVAFKKIYDGTKKILKELNISVDKINNENTQTLLDSSQFKKIKFEGGNSFKGQTNTNLKIIKTNNTSTFPEGLRFKFLNEQDIKINDQITLKANTSPEFKVKITENGKYSLEKAWNISTLAEKIGLNCDASTKQCNLPNKKKINVFVSSVSYVTDTAINDNLTFLENQTGYNQGFKLTTSSDKSIPLIEGTQKSKKISNINKDYSYEIGTKIIDENTTKWFLIRRKSKNKNHSNTSQQQLTKPLKDK